MPDTISITFGYMAPPIGEQCPNMDTKAAEHFTLDAHSIARLLIRGVITDAEAHKARNRLGKSIIKELSK